jgi:hypothetical protein
MLLKGNRARCHITCNGSGCSLFVAAEVFQESTALDGLGLVSGTA